MNGRTRARYLQGVLLRFVALLIVALGGMACRATSSPPPTKHAEVKPRVIYGRTVRVFFEGNRAFSSDELRGVMSIHKSMNEDPARDAVEARSVLERDVLLINATYYDRGYLQVQIDEPKITEATDGLYVDIVIPIKKEGPRIRIRHLSIYERDQDGKEVEALGGGKAALRKRLSIPDGGWFARDVLVKDLQSIRRLYRDAGYAFIEAEPETEIDEAHATVDIIIPVKRGPLVHIEKIEVVGNKKIDASRILGDFQPRVGELFHETKLETSKARLEASGLFRAVDLSTREGSDPAKIIIEIEVREK
jgi:outer membrane protein insertion porin family